ncbi:MAG: geranylgeranyl reductase family protein [Moorea sp. SIOASIH]|uniref:geranylgeranyl reductase family protein n=1 Tax=Moorena sp. SIOASIH TaxID=2607817 RepID=UPI0013B8D468|nr:geranylgeranyl reductase family protein [Moorena sp. SIOASIH]NEO41414.1 geranylgeranyl reductase family protein [Moorena sp. SIOASIH]
MFDCIIVGAGPAGGTAAYHLAKGGKSVVVLEKESLPRYKACSGAVSPQVQQWFDFDFTPAISLKAESVRYTWKMDDPVEVKLDTQEPVWMVQRDVFDHYLIQQAQKQGAEIRDNTAVTGVEFKGDHWQVNTVNGTVEGRYVIAADGATGPMAKWLGFKERKSRLALALEVPKSDTNSKEIHFDFGQVKNGFIWNIPKAEGYSIGLGSLRGGDLKDMEKIVKGYAEKSGLDLSSCKQHEGAICVWEGQEKLHTQNAVLAGEAACVVDPMTAEGIRPSMFSGMKAAEAIQQALAGQADALENYTQVMQQERGTDMSWAAKLAGAFYSFPGIGYKVGVKKPVATQIMLNILCGQLRYSEVVNRAMKRLNPLSGG